MLLPLETGDIEELLRSKQSQDGLSPKTKASIVLTMLLTNRNFSASAVCMPAKKFRSLLCWESKSLKCQPMHQFTTMQLSL